MNEEKNKKRNQTRKYTNDEVTVVWKSELCIHCAKCAVGLPNVFQQKSRPWVKINEASSEQIIEQVKKCPSGALSFYLNEEKEEEDESWNEESSKTTKVEIVDKGPILIKGTILLQKKDGSTETREKQTALCRCGASSRKPFCDGSHKNIVFD